VKHHESAIPYDRVGGWRTILVLCAVSFASASFGLAADTTGEMFYAYIDSDICSRLMPGPISAERIECSETTLKEGASPVVMRLSDNFVLEVNKPKQIKDHVGSLSEVTGVTNEKNGRIKLETVQPVEMSSIPANAPGHELLDVRNFRVTNPKIAEEIRHQLALMAYISEFDFISFTMIGDNVILSGWTVRPSNRVDAGRLVQRIEGVGQVTNNIEVLPMGSIDMQIRASARIRLQKMLARYFWGSGSSIKIVVKHGRIILLGTVFSQADVDIAGIQCKFVSQAHQVINLLKVSTERG